MKQSNFVRVNFVHVLLSAVTIAFFGSFLSGCATIVRGTDQGLTLVTDPAGAQCTLKRRGEIVAIINPTPGTAQVEKSKHDIHYFCEKPGYEPTAGVITSEFQGWTIGNVLLGGIIGAGVDSASGAMNDYDPSATIILRKKGKS